jgi:hypothetical protein
VEQRTLAFSLRMSSATDALTMIQEAFGAYRAVVADCSEVVQAPAWAEVGEILRSFENILSGLVASGEVLVALGEQTKLKPPAEASCVASMWQWPSTADGRPADTRFTAHHAYVDAGWKWSAGRIAQDQPARRPRSPGTTPRSATGS